MSQGSTAVWTAVADQTLMEWALCRLEAEAAQRAAHALGAPLQLAGLVSDGEVAPCRIEWLVAEPPGRYRDIHGPTYHALGCWRFHERHPEGVEVEMAPTIPGRESFFQSHTTSWVFSVLRPPDPSQWYTNEDLRRLGGRLEITVGALGPGARSALPLWRGLQLQATPRGFLVRGPQGELL